MTDQPTPYYRYVDETYESTGTRVIRQTLYLFKKTPKGAWITWPWDREGICKKFVLDGDGRRYAYTDTDKALHSFKIRKQRQIQRCRATIECAETALEIIEQPEFDKNDDGYMRFSTASDIIDAEFEL